MTGWVIQLLAAVALVGSAAPASSGVVVPEPAPTPAVVFVVPEATPQASVLTPAPSLSAPLRVSAAQQPQIEAWTEQYGNEYGVSPQTLRYMARCESTFNPKAVSGPYGGMFQYSASSWSSNRKVMGEDSNPILRFDAQAAIKTTAFIVSIRGGGMWPNCFPRKT